MIRVRLLDMMERANIRSQRELSEMTGLSQTTLTKVRRQHAFRHDTLDTLCGALNCQPGDLLEYVEE